MIAKGWIKPSRSPFGALLLFFRKNTGELRMCIDYRILNKNTGLDRYPIPRIDDLLDRLAHATVFSKADLTNVYHQVPIAADHQYKTAFQVQFGIYEWVLLAQGLCNAPATFLRLMHNVFDSALDSFIPVYFDDILIFSRNEEERQEHIRFALERLRSYKLKAKLRKYAFDSHTVEYLGHIIEAGTIKDDSSKVSAVIDWPVPQDIKQL